jgi:hypothetical protein
MRTLEELRDASHHLHYEINMLRSLAQGLASGIAGQGTIANALLESFVIHLRCVLDFLYPPADQRPDDVVAQDYFDDWENRRPPMPAKLSKVRGRAGKEVAHLTYARLDVTAEAKRWPFVELFNEAYEVLDVFLKGVDRNKLSDDWLTRKPGVG